MPPYLRKEKHSLQCHSFITSHDILISKIFKIALTYLIINITINDVDLFVIFTNKLVCYFLQGGLILNAKGTYAFTRKLIGLIAALSIVLFLSGCGESPASHIDTVQSSDQAQSSSNSADASPAPSAKIKVVAAENFLGEVLSAVGGDRVDVLSIIHNPDADPHAFEPTAETSKAVSDAQLVVYVGIGYDEWMKKLLSASSASKAIINVGGDLLGKKSGDNPHVWYIPDSMAKLADAAAEKLSRIDPSDAEAYKKRADAYKASLVPLTDLMTQLKQPTPTDIAVSEPVFDYMADALNLHIINPKFAKAIEEESDPAPMDMANLQNALSSKQVKLFVQNIQADSPTVKNMVNLSQKNHIPVVHVTETEPAGKTYLQWMTDQLNEVKQALQTK